MYIGIKKEDRYLFIVEWGKDGDTNYVFYNVYTYNKYRSMGEIAEFLSKQGYRFRFLNIKEYYDKVITDKTQTLEDVTKDIINNKCIRWIYVKD